MKLAEAPELADRFDQSPTGASVPDLGSPSARPSHRLAVTVAFGLLLLAFSIHLAVFGSWIVDDAGISFAYAANVVHGHGVVAQAGQPPVEGFSNPAWVAIFTILTRIRLFGADSVLGAQGYVVIVKALAIALHGVVLAGLALIIRRVLEVARRSPAPFRVWCTCWVGAGLLLAANPSYVIWMGSGLENPLLAATVVGLAAVAMTAVPNPSRRAMVGLGLLAALAALTRPDGVVYVAVIVVAVLLTPGSSPRWRATRLAWGLVPFLCVFGTYLTFRVAYFGVWTPNTAVAKHQTMPTIGDLVNVRDIPFAFGVTASASAAFGVIAAIVTLRRDRNTVALRVLSVGLATLALGVVAYLVLPTDWMSELRFLTPVWPLLSATVVLACAQLVALVSSRHVRVGILVLVTVAVLLSVPGWARGSRDFRAQPTLSLCSVASRYGAHLQHVARLLDVAPRSMSAASPDIGGMLLVDDARVVDLAGLTNRTIARSLWHGGVAEYVLGTARPTVIVVHGDWLTADGLLDDARLRSDYVDVYRGEEWVRRDALARVPDADLAVARIESDAVRSGNVAPRASCGALLFGTG